MGKFSMPGQMQAKCIDYGQNFLTGQATSILSATGIDVAGDNLKDLADAIQDKTMSMVSELKNTATKEVTKVGSQIGEMAGSLAGAGLSAVQGAFQSADLAKLAIGDITTYAAQEVGKRITKTASMAAAFPAKVTKRATEIAKEKVKEELAERLKIVTGTTAENENKKKAKEQKENKIKNVVNNVKDFATKANKFKDKMLAYAQEDCQEISELMIQGPTWVNNQLDSATETSKKFISDNLDKGMDDVTKWYDKAVEDSATALATTMVDDMIKPTLDKASDLFNETNKNVNKQKQKAKTAVQKQLFKIAGKLGISPNG